MRFFAFLTKLVTFIAAGEGRTTFSQGEVNCAEYRQLSEKYILGGVKPTPLEVIGGVPGGP